MTLNVEQAVRERYSAASKQAEASLCCPIEYDGRYLEVLPQELIDRDYGCGDPSRYLNPGETVLDLGSGGGKICYIASQIVGAEGRVLGVDMNDDMLSLARQYQSQIGDAIGWHNVEFFKGRIQDLGLNLDLLAARLAEQPIADAAGWLEAEAFADQLRRESPMIANDSVDVVLSNCVLNLVRKTDRLQLFRELFRVLKRGGRVVISDIVSDEEVPESLQQDPTLWSGCISGAFQEAEFLRAFEQAGFYGVEIVERQVEPWAVVQDIEFRSVTLRAFKGKEGPCRDGHQAVIYRGPWQSVTDDDGHVLKRGVRTAVCQKTFEIYTRPPYREQVCAVEPLQPVADEDAREFDCHRGEERSAKVTKGTKHRENLLPVDDCCGPDCC